MTAVRVGHPDFEMIAAKNQQAEDETQILRCAQDDNAFVE
jgi:hypothetical protein